MTYVYLTTRFNGFCVMWIFVFIEWFQRHHCNLLLIKHNQKKVAPIEVVYTLKQYRVNSS